MLDTRKNLPTEPLNSIEEAFAPAWQAGSLSGTEGVQDSND